ncbi:LytR/AlgR family response regulator transcription factor [Actinocrispum wychmicini]|uniref:LytTR family two component transcriptional regulator n=1 Tax=Actinocrispum wychmicini TaxID=1213861 RepID=A0A4R2ITQ8_9PSEU|nr:LytTR family DNA-binding domain-containing protein [Actinocrispum wychmicini]TCO48883.1 LytTR family two component transcriptional regulator [Actinocrispum wychmicini]
MRVLAVDDVPAALDELCRMLRDAPEVTSVVGAQDPLTALRMIQSDRFDVVFLDISMPALDGLELASLLTRLSEPPVIVFVTAHEEHAVAAFGIGAVDYLLKPLRAERLADTLARVNKRTVSPVDTMAALPVEVGGRTKYVRRSDVQFVEAHGDYVRLHTRTGAYLVRMPLSRLQEYWENAGFARVHRGFLVALGSVRELRSDSAGGLLAHTDLGDVPVSRRHSRELRQRLLRAAQRGDLDWRS